MTKVKKDSKKSTSSSKAKTAPVKSNSGMVRKVRVNIKNLKKADQQTSDISVKKSNIYKDSDVLSKSRSLVVKLRRLPTNNFCSKASDNNKNDTLRSRHNEVEKNKTNVNIESKEETTPLVNKKKDAKQSTTTKITMSSRNKTNADALTANSALNETNSSSKLSLHGNCRVKVKRLLRRVDVKEPTTASCPKHCVVRLQKTPVTNMNNFSAEKTRNFKIKLQRIPLQQIKNKSTVKRYNLKSRTKSANMQPSNAPLKEVHDHNIKSLNSFVLDVQLNEENTKKQSIALSKLKHLPRLSLKKINNKKGNKASPILNKTQFNPHQNSTITEFNFEPVRNSTFLEFGFNKGPNIGNLEQKEINENSEEHTPLKNKSLSSQHLDNKCKSSKVNTTTKNRSDSQNLANKSDEIESLLNSLDDDTDDDENIIKLQDKNSPSKTNKFFHSKVGNLYVKSMLVDKPKTRSKHLIEKQQINNQKRISKKRSSLIKRKDVYEFLSQSQTSDSDGYKCLDPAADIIKKLIDQGKVRVATNCKGKGKPVFKRVVLCKQTKKIKQNAAKNRKQIKNSNNVKSITKASKEIEHHPEEDHRLDDDFAHDLDNRLDDDFAHDLDNDDLIMAPDISYDLGNISNNIRKRFNNNSKNEQEGTFSRLARSVLIHQAGCTNSEKKNASKLVEMVKKYYSTPKNKQKLPKTALDPYISPISMPPQPPRPETKLSPWRIEENANLPRVFNFSRNSANLPSFSSDYIPPSPRKDNSKCNTKTNEASCVFNDNTLQSFLPVIENQDSLPLVSAQSSISDKSENGKQHKESSIIPSFSSNDSNAENMPPVAANLMHDEHNENNDIFNLKQLPNPRRTLTYRSPLKAINILEVVHLPPYKDPNKTNVKMSSDVANMLGFKNHRIVEEALQANQNFANVSKSPQKKCDKRPNSFVEDKNIAYVSESHKKNCDERRKIVEEDLFGFEEFLSQNSALSQEYENTNENNDSITEEPHITIHDKLQDLRKLKPKDNELQLDLVGEKSNYPFELFENEPNSVGVDGMKQKSIKEMLCSTMIHPQPSTSRNALKELEKRNFCHAKKLNEGDDSDISELFKDCEPETTFNENEAHRTYIRPYKRKRRLKENNYVVFLESDESGSEEIHNVHKKQNHSNDTDTSSEMNTKKKRHRKMPKESQELKEFVEEFNKMCKEVDSYELLVE